MHCNFQKADISIYNLTSSKLSFQRSSFSLVCFLSRVNAILRNLLQSLHRSSLSRPMLVVLSFGLSLMMTSYSSQTLTAETVNVIQGNAPYFTIDGGRTRLTNLEDLLEITLSNGKKFNASNSSDYDEFNPIPVPAGDSFADIAMIMPIDDDPNEPESYGQYRIDMDTLINPPYNYWGDDDGDGDVTAKGFLYLDITDRYGDFVEPNEVLTICKAPYFIEFNIFDVTLETRYGVPKSDSFKDYLQVIYIVSPDVPPSVCYAKPILKPGDSDRWQAEYAGSPSIWSRDYGFLTQSYNPSSYGLNFPTTGSNNLYFDLIISGNKEALSWDPVTHGGITATMTNSTKESVRVTLTGPVATPSQWVSDNPGYLPKPVLPQTFELVGKDSKGNAVVKYGFQLKKWFITKGDEYDAKAGCSVIKSWCNSIGYRMVLVNDVTNAYYEENGINLGALPSSQNYSLQRNISAGLFSEWGLMYHYPNAHYGNDENDEVDYYMDRYTPGSRSECYRVYTWGSIDTSNYDFPAYGLCVYP